LEKDEGKKETLAGFDINIFRRVLTAEAKQIEMTGRKNAFR